jgi:hypothetical protein
MSSHRSRPHRAAPDPRGELRIRSDLRDRGIAVELHAAFAERLAPISQSGSPEAYEAALDAVALAYRNGAPSAKASLDELQQLMSGFSDELRKLEEAMRILDAYVSRMRSQTDASEDHLLH